MLTILAPVCSPTSGLFNPVQILSWIGVREGRQGQGLSKQFLTGIAEDLRARGYRRLHTDTASTNMAAQRFYERFGFSSLGRTRSYLKIG